MSNISILVSIIKQAILNILGRKNQDKLKPVTGKRSILTRDEFLNKLAKFGIKPIATDVPLDSEITIANKTELAQIAPSLVYPASYYVAETWDCEDYAIQAQSDAARIFKVNGIRMVLGDMPLGYHGFLITVDTDDNAWWLENNAGFVYAGEWRPIGDEGYIPRRVFA